MNENENYELDQELAKSIEKIVDEETIVAKAFVDRNASNEIDKNTENVFNQSNTDKEIFKTQIIPDLSLEKENYVNNSEIEEKNKKQSDKKPSNNKKKLIIAGIAGSIVIIAIIITAAIIINKSNKSSFRYNYEKGNEYYNNKDYSTAIRYYESAEQTSDGKNNLDLKFKMSDSYASLGNQDRAVEELKDILSYQKNNEKALSALSELYALNKMGNEMTDLIRKYHNTDGEKYLKQYVVAVPVASKEPGKYDEAADLELTVDDSNNKIYYTLDGSVPTGKSTLYTEPIHLVKGDTTVKVISVNSIGTQSDVAELKYTIDYKAPEAATITPATGTYQEGQKIEITNIKSGDKAYYTLDGSTPTNTSTLYSEAFQMPEGNTIVSVIIVNQYGLESSVTRRNYNVIAAKTYTFDEALNLLRDRMKAIGDLKTNNTMADGKPVKFVYYTKQKINDIDMYLVYCDIDGVRQKYYYGIGLKNGKSYKVSESSGAFIESDY